MIIQEEGDLTQAHTRLTRRSSLRWPLHLLCALDLLMMLTSRPRPVTGRRARWRKPLAVLSVVASLQSGCPGSCARPARQTRPSAPSRPVSGPLHEAQLQWVPAQASAVVLFVRLSELTQTLQGLDAHTPAASPLRAWAEGWSRHLALDPRQPEAWAARGFRLDRPASVFRHGERWAMVLDVREDDAALRAWVRSLKPTTPIPGANPRAWTVSAGAPGARLVLARRGEHVLLSGDAALFPGNPPTAASDLAPWLQLDATTRWDARPDHRELRRQLAPLGPIFGVAQPGEWLDTLRTGTMDARRVRDRMVAQSGRIGWVARHDADARRLRMRVLALEDLGEPTTLPSISAPRTPLDEVSGLVREDALGVLRVSAHVEDLMALVMANLSTEQRAAWDQWLARLKREVDLDLKDAVFDNLRGHAVLVAYGLDLARAMQADPNAREPWMLRATQEAVYLPIRDRIKLEYVLDAVTQLTHQRLVRQRVDEVVQYAWLDDGVLEWALLLTDDAILYVDGPLAFERAASFLRARRRGTPQPTVPDAARLLEHPSASGVYVNVAQLRAQLEQANMSAITPWLKDVQGALVISREQGRGSNTEIELDLRAPALPDPEGPSPP